MPLDGSPDKNKTLTDVQKTLLEAADLLRKHGRCTISFRTPEGRICLAEAIFRAADQYGTHIEAMRWMQRHVTNGEPVMYWNDIVAQSDAQVISALESAAFSTE